MFPWNIARSAEALLSRWAIKRVCKFLLKKKLGNFIVGDIDLDQLDVQLGAGTIQLSDLALNVDYINTKLDATSVFVKEGSIGSLVVKVPWKVQNCQIEIKELEFVLTSRSNSSSSEDCSISNANEANKEEDCVAEETNNSDHEKAHGNKNSIPLDVHQGVKTIAKMVKWLLTNFNIKIKNLIVAFDSSIEKVGKISEQSRVLVLRMNEIEYGTHVSESYTTAQSSSYEDSFLGMTSLTNFVKFSGAAVDILQLEPSSSASSVSILTGKAGGFSGNVKLSIPWKNGSLDMQRLEADVSIDPVVLKLQPSTITSLLYLWKFLRRFNVDKKCNVPHVSKVSALSDSSSQYHSFTRGSSVALSGGRPLLSSFTSQEAPIDALLPGAHYIPNWVRLSSSSEYEGDEEPDYAASVDQFFECLDGMRSAQSSLYHSGLLNWTCSVFNTISAASNLASGSVCIPETPQPCEMNIKASVGGIAIVLSVHDEREGVHYLMANCKDLVLAFQICSEKTNFQATLRHFRIDEYYEDKDRNDCQALDCDGNSQDKDPPVQFLQTEVLSAMPQWDFSPCPDAEGMISGLPEVDVIRVPILEFSDDCSCLVNMSSSSMVGVRESSVSFTVKLAPFILWVISSPINVLVDLMKKVCNSPEVENTSGILNSEPLYQSWNLQYKENVIMGGTSKHVTAKSPIKNVQGSVSLSNARLIVCFPFQCGDRNLRSFIGLDFSHGLNGGGLDLYPKSAISSLKGLSEPSIEVHLRFGDLNAYLITSSCRNSNNHALLAKRFLFVSRNKKGECSSIGILWQENPVSGPCAAKKAKCRATSNDSKRTRTKIIGKDCEFATARIATGPEEGNGCLLQEMIMGSALSFHACFPLIQIELDSCEYRQLLYLLTEGINDFMCGACDLGIVDNEGNKEDLVDSYHGGEPSQTTIILECDVLSIYATLECAEVGSCLQRELPGYWASLRLNVEKFELFSASNVGGSNGAKFLSISHGEGELWGSLDESVGANHFLLVSCSNSAMKRGDGEGTNALSSYSGGSTIVNFCESLSLNNYTSVSIRCATIIAPGGRLDWMSAVCSFFSLSSERESPVECSLQETCAEDSFSLSLVDSALSYEPKISVRNPEVLGSEHTHEEFVACIIAMSVLDVSKHAMGSSTANDYKLRLLDVGLLVSTMSGSTVRRDYGVDALRKNGYVKVAGEAIIDLDIRVNSSEEPLWELECSDFHVKLNTCQDTTAAIVHLASQLQQLFAPDIEESLAHLQTRWDMVQQAHGASEDTANLSNLYMNCNPFPSGSSHDHALKKDDVVGLMDEIVQDAFQLSRDQTPRDTYRIPPCVKEELVPAASESNMRSDRLTDACPIVPKFSESYCISRLLPLDSFPKDGYFSNDNSYFEFKRPVQGKTSSAKNSGWYEDCSWNIVENHVSNADNVDEIHEGYNIVLPISVSRAESCIPRGRVILKNFSIWWKMYNGLDWNLPTSSRDSTCSMEWVLSSMNVQYDIFAEGEMYVSKLILSIREFHLYDRTRDAPWKMVLGYYHTKDRPRESYAESLKVELETVRPEPQIPLEEYRLCLSLLPLRLNLDQSQLDFLVKFFAFQSPSSDLLLDASNDSSKSIGLPTKNTRCGEPNVVAEALLPFFQKCDINPVVVRVDYNPRHIDLAALRGGNYTELLNLVPWKGIELLLKDVHAVGLYGWGNVCETVLGEWLEDISHNQIHKLLKGLAPIRPLVAVGTGAAKLVSLPVKSYRKDQRLLKGMQRGAVAFVRSISLEAVGLGVHLAAGAHDILLQTECILTSGSSSVPRNINKRSVRSNQPRNARQGMLQAYDSLSDGLGKTASALVVNPLKTYQRGGGAGSALASAICAAPTAAIAPASAAARAMHFALLGVRNSLSPERKKESVEKYSGPSQSISISETGDSGGKNVQRLPLV